LYYYGKPVALFDFTLKETVLIPDTLSSQSLHAGEHENVLFLKKVHWTDEESTVTVWNMRTKEVRSIVGKLAVVTTAISDKYVMMTWV
jgi:hypothetical protein